MEDIINIYPTSEELLTIANCVSCLECNMTFRSNSNLTLHHTKTHKRSVLKKLDPLLIKLYHCPEQKCSYNSIVKPFRTCKLLKQHYLKVHAPKQLGCTECGKCFPVRASYYNHLPYCGIVFNCNSCPAIYDSYETLKTHARRKNHFINAKTAFSRMPQLPTKSKSELLPSTFRTANRKQRATASSSDEQLILNKSSQTDVKQQSNRLVLPRLEIRDENTRFAETQTVGDYRLKKSNSSEESFDKNTQTRKVPSYTKSCNTSMVFNEEVVVDINTEALKQSTHSSTQTNLQIPFDNNFKTLSLDSDSSVTTTCDVTPELAADEDDTLFFNMETQTDCTELISNMLDGDYYTNMYTQTCSDIFNEDLGLNNICTQTTILDDDDLLLRSVESQTTKSHSAGSFIMCRDFNHIQTQTDAEFKELFDAINA